jgi:hypothetical protein
MMLCIQLNLCKQAMQALYMQMFLHKLVSLDHCNDFVLLVFFFVSLLTTGAKGRVRGEERRRNDVVVLFFLSL